MMMDEERQGVMIERIGRRWREGVDKLREYEILEEGEEEFAPFLSFYLPSQDYQKAQRLKEKLIEEYKGKTLEEVIKGKELETERGRCYHITFQEKINLRLFNPEVAREKILSELTLIYGIGEVTKGLLEKEGYKTIKDLARHPRFGSEAERFLEILSNNWKIANWIERWFSKSHPLLLYSSSLYKKENLLLLDIETLGLFTRPIILLGIVKISEGEIWINQYFVREIKEEPSALAGFLSQINRGGVLITFNGRRFDIPYIRERLAYYQMEGDLERPHFDVLSFSRRRWREKFPNYRLTTLERYLLGIERKDDVPSALVPEFYESYLRTKNVGPLIPIIEHNRRDLITLLNIFSRLHEEWER